MRTTIPALLVVVLLFITLGARYDSPDGGRLGAPAKGGEMTRPEVQDPNSRDPNSDDDPVRVFAMADLRERQQKTGRSYLPFLRVPALNCGIYRLKKGAVDRQTPHGDDEVYYVIAGKAKFRSGDDVAAVGPGSIIYVEAKADHRFEKIDEDLELLVFFATATSEPKKKTDRR